MIIYNILFSIYMVAMVSCAPKTNEFYVSMEGNDDNPGTKSQPFLSFGKAKEAVSQVIREGAENEVIHVYFREGRYYFDQSVVIQGEEFKSGNNRIIFSSYENEKPVFSSGKKLEDWEKVGYEIPFLPESAKGKIWETDIPDDILKLSPRFLCNDTTSFTLAISEGLNTMESDDVCKVRNDINSFSQVEKLSSFAFPKQYFRNWGNLGDIEIITRPQHAWVMNILPLKTIDLNKGMGLTAIPGTYKINRIYYEQFLPNLWVQNAIDYLDEPGEWVINSDAGKIYYWAEEDAPTNVYCPVLQELIRVEGNEENNCILKNIEFRGITFAHGSRDTWENDAIGIQHDWALYDESDALLRFVDTEGCLVNNCTFTTSGGGGVRFDFYSQGNKVMNCKFNNLGGTPILFAGYGPGGQNVNRNNEIFNNDIHDFGQEYWHSPGIFVWQSGGNRIANNLIYNAPYTGLVISGPRPNFFNQERIGTKRELSGTFNYENIEDGVWEDWDKIFPYLFSDSNIIECNELHHVVQTLDDGNAIYLSGTGYGNIVRRNYVHDNTSGHRHGAIRGDDFTRDITITENIVYRFARFGILMKGVSTITNNYVIDYIPTGRLDGKPFPKLSFIMIYALGPIKGSVIKNNICYQPGGVSEPYMGMRYLNPYKYEYDETAWPPKYSDCDIDNNLYYSAGEYELSKSQLQKMNDEGVDLNSVVADPLFEGFAEAGFKLKDNSPAFKLGIKQIDFENIGLIKLKND